MCSGFLKKRKLLVDDYICVKHENVMFVCAFLTYSNLAVSGSISNNSLTGDFGILVVNMSEIKHDMRLFHG